MTEQAWLPDTAFTDRSVARALAPALAIWSARWFTSDLAINIDHRGAPAETPVCRARRIAALDALTGTGKRVLLECALGMLLLEKSLNGGDHRLLDAFAMRIVDDLLAAIDTTIGGDRDHRWVLMAVAIEGEAVLTAAVPRAALSVAIRHGLSRSSAPSSLLSIPSALRVQEIEAEGILGEAEFTLTEVRTLNVGDVLVFERDLKDVVDLRVAGGNRPIGRGKLGREGDRVTIRIQ